MQNMALRTKSSSFITIVTPLGAFFHRADLPHGLPHHSRRERPTRETPTGLSNLGLALVLVASFMVVLDFSIVNVALPSIRTSLSFGGDSVQWVVTAYAIVFGALLILGGRTADLFGRRRALVVGLAIFTVASLAGGLAHDAALLVIARALQGVGAALVAPASLSLITAHIAEGPRRTRALALYGATASVGFVAGQVLGGVLVQFASWRWVFLVNVPIGALGAMVAPLWLAHDRARGRLAHVDFGGGVLSVTSVASLVYAVSQGPVVGWRSATIIAAFVISLVSIGGFVIVERSHSHPLVNLALFKRSSLRSASIITVFLGMWTAGELVVMSIYLQQSLHESALFAGLVIAPQGVIGFVTGVVGVRLVRRLGLQRLLLAATLSTFVGFFILAHLPTSGTFSPVFAAVIFIGFGTVGTIFASTAIATNGVADADQGLVGAVVNTTRQVGAALGVALMVAVADGAHARSGVSTVSGDRSALYVASLFALVATVVAWFAARSPKPILTRRAPTTVAASRRNDDVLVVAYPDYDSPISSQGHDRELCATSASGARSDTDGGGQ